MSTRVYIPAGPEERTMPQRRAQTQPKRKRDAAATRSAILEAATRRFASEGYEHTGVREIAADAGAAVAAALAIGFAIMDLRLRPQPIATARREQLVALLSESLAVCIG